MKVERELVGQLRDNVTVLRDAWGPLRRRAYYLSSRRVDADDLLASAVASAWEKWTVGTGPSTNIVAYVTQSMRNRVIDELRSPRASEMALDDLVVDPSYVDDYSEVDFHTENAQLQAALQRLPAAFQRTLVDVVVNGRRPRDLEEEYRMSAPAISTTAYRAKKALRAGLFLEMMHEFCTDPACRDSQVRVAQELRRSAGIDDQSVGVSELWRCCSCASGLRHYIEMVDRRAA